MFRSISLAFATVLMLGACGDGANDDQGLGSDRDARNASRSREEQSEPQDGRGGTGLARASSADRSDVEQSEADAEQSDLQLIAAANGWTLDETRLYFAKTDAVGDVAGQIFDERPGVLVGSAVGPAPTDVPRVYIKGPADNRVREIAASTAFEILVVDLQPFSLDEIAERQSLLADELRKLGFLYFSLGADIQREGLMSATVERTVGAPGSVDEIFAVLPAPLREHTSIQLMDNIVHDEAD